MKRERHLHNLKEMLCFGTIALALAALAAGSGTAWALSPPEGNAPWPTENQRRLHLAENQPQPYALNYTDQVARRLGLREGRWQAFAPRSGELPALQGGLKGGRPMLILQWRPSP